MLVEKERYDELKGKKNFVYELSLAFQDPDVQRRTTVDFIYYDVFAVEGGYLKEYVVVVFKGGAKSVRNCAGNSLTAIFRAIGQLIDGGYYDEVETYERLKEKEECIRVEY